MLHKDKWEPDFFKKFGSKLEEKYRVFSFSFFILSRTIIPFF